MRIPIDSLNVINAACYSSEIFYLNRGEEHQVMVHVEMSGELLKFLNTNQLYQHIFDHSSDTVFFISLDGMIVEMNAAAGRLLNFTKEELLHTAIINHVHHEDVKLISQAFHPSRSNTSTETEIRLRHKTNGYLPVKLTAIPIVVNNSMIGLCGIVKHISMQKKLEDKMVQLAFYDQLTGLPNRMLFERKLKKRVQDAKYDPSSSFALVLLDINRFHTINETLGHMVGNHLIKETVKRLSTVVKPGDSLSRIGNDEFAFLLTIDSQLNGLLDKIHLILRTLDEEPFLLENIEFVITASMGISLFQETGLDDMTLFKHAETALRRAKFEKKKMEIYNQEMDVQTYKSFTLENDLRKPLNWEEFEVYYQPRINTATNQIVSAEALIRWNHPNWGELAPGEFISLSERNGSIHSIGMWVLETVCKQIKWGDNAGVPMRISVNFSALQLLKPSIVHDIMEMIHKYHVNPNAIEIEITEHALMSNKELMQTVIAELNQQGIHIAIDDFGTGYSSLSYLLNFKINTLKIDRAFIKELAANEDSKEITSAIIKLGQKLKLNLVAEGVETPEQLAILRRVQCNEIQGYLYSKAVTAQELGQMLKKGKLEPKQTVYTADVINQRNFFRVSFPSPLEADMTIDEINNVKVNVGKTLIAVENIGPGGLGFHSSIKLPNKRGIVLAFDTSILDHALKLYGQIVWSREAGEHNYEYGVELIIDEADRANLTKILNQLQILFRHKQPARYRVAKNADAP